MATTTTNLGLSKPAYSDDADVAVINGNMDILDTKIGAVGNTSVQAQINTNSQAITKLNNNFGTSTTRISTNVQSYLNTLGDGHHNVAFTYDAPGLPYTSSTDCHVFIWDKNNHNGMVYAINTSQMAYVGLLNNGVLTWQELARNDKIFSITVNVTYTNGIGEYSDARITPYSRISAIRSINAVPTNYIVGAYPSTGKVTIVLNNAIAGSLGTMIFVDNR